MFVAARLILGFGDAIVLASTPLFIAKIAYPQDRVALVTRSGASYYSGGIYCHRDYVCTPQIKSDWSWRLLSLLQVIYATFILVVVY